MFLRYTLDSHWTPALVMIVANIDRHSLGDWGSFSDEKSTSQRLEEQRANRNNETNTNTYSGMKF